MHAKYVSSNILPPVWCVAAVAEWYRYWIGACLVTGSSPVPLKTRRAGQRCTLNLSRAQTSSRWCGVVVRRGVPAQVSSTSLDQGSKLREPKRHGGTLNSRRASSPLVWLAEKEERWEAPGHLQGFLSLNWGGTEQNRTVTCMVLKAKDNDMRKNSSP
ncbi:uncharacterized protein TNCV_854271 [Trichonephila clavipes]|nr:uncharacterized protein TNCV_854271 [Trichonephila clavipes]